MNDFINRELDRAGLPHNTFAQDALGLVIRSSDGVLKKARNLCLSCMIEAVRSNCLISSLSFMTAPCRLRVKWGIELLRVERVELITGKVGVRKIVHDDVPCEAEF